MMVRLPLTIVVTRPAVQAQPLIQQLRLRGERVLLFPTLEIKAIRNSDVLPSDWTSINHHTIVIFVSVNAVIRSDPFIDWTALSSSSAKIAAMGQATAAVLEQRQITVDFIPQAVANSEGLLALPAFAQLSGSTITIVRGEGGREYLAQGLKQRGACVHYREVYRRCCPKADIEPVLQTQPDVIVVTSNQALQNLYDLTPHSLREQLQHCRLLLVSQRAITLAQGLGFVHAPLLAKAADTRSIIDCLAKESF